MQLAGHDVPHLLVVDEHHRGGRVLHVIEVSQPHPSCPVLLPHLGKKEVVLRDSTCPLGHYVSFGTVCVHWSLGTEHGPSEP